MIIKISVAHFKWNKEYVFQISQDLKSEIVERTLYPCKKHLRKTREHTTNLKNVSSRNDLIAG